MSVSVPLRLRPLEIGDLLDETFRMYRRHFLLFAGISVILAIPTAALFGLGFGSLTLALQQAGQADLSSLTPLLASFGAGLLITFLILPFTNTAVVYAACESALGRPVTAGGIFMGVLRRYFPLLGYWLRAAFGRSRQLVEGRWWRTFLVLFLMLIVWYVARFALDAFLQLAQYLLAIVVSPFIVAALTLGTAELVSALVSPVLQIVIVLIYFDLRVRREALDLFQIAYRIAYPAAAS